LVSAEEGRQIPRAEDAQLLPRKKRTIPTPEEAGLLGDAKNPKNNLPLLTLHRYPTPMRNVCEGCRARERAALEEKREKKKTWLKVVENVAMIEAILNGRTEEDLRRKDGKQYGMVGGKDPNGFNNPVVQTIAVAIAVTASVVGSPQKLTEKLKEALEKKGTLVIEKVDEAGIKAVEGLIEDEFAREAMAKGLEASRSVGPYKLFKKVTEGLRKRYEAHHLYAQRWGKALDKFEEEALDDIPSVILPRKVHEEMTSRLTRLAKRAEKSGPMTKEKLWQIYEEVYKDSPHWLKAIEHYFR